MYFYSFSAYYAYLGAHLRLYVYIFLSAFLAVGATVPILNSQLLVLRYIIANFS